MGTLGFAQPPPVLPSREMAAENAGPTLSADQVGDAQERRRATFVRGEREDLPKGARLTAMM